MEINEGVAFLNILSSFIKKYIYFLASFGDIYNIT
jgi:hypothetical protein